MVRLPTFTYRSFTVQKFTAARYNNQRPPPPLAAPGPMRKTLQYTKQFSHFIPTCNLYY